MNARSVELVELRDGDCHLVVEVEGVSLIVAFTADEAIGLGGQLLDGGHMHVSAQEVTP